jgi:Zn-dependent peptidase ImmA (M78 family)
MAFIRQKMEQPPSASIIPGLNSPDELILFAKNKNICLEPLDVSKLTQALGIIMRMEPLQGDESGSLKKNKKTGEWVMTINSLHHPHRQRFTIAHEIGHYLKHSFKNDFFEDQVFFRNGDTNKMETEANKFAAELLMPEPEFRKYISEHSASVSDIAEHFHVSSMAVRVRAKQLGFQGHNL